MLGSPILCAPTIDIEGYNVANQLVNDGTNTLTYDDNGNLTSDGVNSYTWDRANRLLSVGGAAYQYDGVGNRIRQTVSSIVTDYLNNVQPGLAKLLAQTTGATTERFIHAPRGIHAMEDNSGNWTYPVQDGLGSVRGMVSDALAVNGMQHYAPYGDPFGAQGSLGMDFGFTGEQTDGSGQVYLRARYYNPGIGVFTALDPVEGMMDRPMSLNGYSWVEGNPVMNTDPSGMQCGWGGGKSMGWANACGGGEALAGGIILAGGGTVLLALWKDLRDACGSALTLLLSKLGIGTRPVNDFAVASPMPTLPPYPATPYPMPTLPPYPAMPYPMPTLPPYPATPYPMPTLSPYPATPYPMPTLPPYPATPPFTPEPVVMASPPDISALSNQLSRIFRDYSSTSFKCDKSADQAGTILQNAGYDVEILRLENRLLFGDKPPQFIPVKSPSGEIYNISESGWHEVIEISNDFYIDSLVYEHFGMNAQDWETYMELFVYPDELIRAGTRKPNPDNK